MTAHEMDQKKFGGFCRRECVESPALETLLEQMNQLQIEESEILGHELVTGSRKGSLRDGLKCFGLPVRYKSFLKQKSSNRVTNFTKLRKKLRKFCKRTAQTRDRVVTLH